MLWRPLPQLSAQAKQTRDGTSSARLAALKQFLKGAPRGPRVTQLVEWAGQDLARRRLSISAAKLENRLAKKELFGHDDGCGFKPHQYRKDGYDFEWDDNW
jgi:hypothetical protein